MHELVRSEAFGPVRYYNSTRVNLGLFQHDVNVLWDLAVHDLSIMQFVLDQRPVAVSATGQSLMSGQPEYAAFLTVFFGGSTIAHINVNWLSPVKEFGGTLVGGDRQMVVYDDLEASEKIKLYDKGIDIRPTSEQVHKLLISYRTGDLWSPNVPATEALAIEAAHFAACVRGRRAAARGRREGAGDRPHPRSRQPLDGQSRHAGRALGNPFTKEPNDRQVPRSSSAICLDQARGR